MRRPSPIHPLLPSPPTALARAAAVVGTFILTSAAVANVTVATWTSTSWDFNRTQVPDVDQLRSALPNNGSCHCVPTSCLNILGYVSNHGFPMIDPPPTAWALQSNYFEASAYIDYFAGIGGTAVGGIDPVSGEELGCGTPDQGGVDIVKAAISATNDLIVVGVTNSSTWAPTDSYLAQLSAAPAHPVISCGYGRYDILGYTSEGWPKITITGGHRTSLTGARFDFFAGERWITVRDPADDGNLESQSPFANRKIDCDQIRVAIPIDGDPDGFTTRVVAALNYDPDAETMAHLRSAIILWPKTGCSFTEVDITPNLPLSKGFGGGLPPLPPPIPSPGGQFTIDVAPQMDNLDHFVLTVPSAGSSQASLWQTSLASVERVLLATIPNATQLCTGRGRDLFVAAGATVVRFVPDVGPTPTGTMTLPGSLAAIGYDDATDSLVACSASARQVYRFSGDLNGSIQTSTIPRSVPLAGATRLSIDPTTQAIWICSEGSDALFGLSQPAAGGPMQVETFAPPTIVGPTSVDFDDHGRMHVVAADGVHVFDHIAGGWVEGDASAFDDLPIGKVLRVARSRTNAGRPDVEPEPADIPADELVPLGILIVDCAGDVDHDGQINGTDLATLLGSWGPCVPGASCAADLDLSGSIDGGDLAILLGAWGACD